MKVASIACLLCCGLAMAEPNLLVHVDFNNKNVANSITSTNYTFSVDNIGTAQYSSTGYLTGSAGATDDYSFANTNSELYLDNKVTGEKDFTLTFAAALNGTATSVADWSNICVVYGGLAVPIQWTNKDTIGLYNSSGAGASTTATLTSNFSRLTLVYTAAKTLDDGTTSDATFTLYQDATKLTSVKSDLGTGNFSIKIGGGGCVQKTDEETQEKYWERRPYVPVLIDEIGLYEGALTQDQISTYLVGKATGAVPEPTTATLSLLALAGLAARRRRK